jgi:hypothetical protein
MPEMLVYPRIELPPDLNWQIISFMRVLSPGSFPGFDWLKYWACEEGNDHSRHIVLVENRILISHGELVWKDLEHRAKRTKHMVSPAFSPIQDCDDRDMAHRW